MNTKHNIYSVHRLCYLAALTIWIYAMLYLFINHVVVYQIMSFMFYNLQTTDSIFASKNRIL